MKHLKRNVTIAAVLLLVCAAVYLNWSYNNKWGNGRPCHGKGRGRGDEGGKRSV